MIGFLIEPTIFLRVVKADPNKVITLRLPPKIEKVLREKAKENRTTISYVIVDCLRKRMNIPDHDDVPNNIS